LLKREPRAARCLRNGSERRLSRCLPLLRMARTGGFGAARGSRGRETG
jgi:hypothetical protein